MSNSYQVEIVFPIYYKNLDIVEDSTIKLLNYLKQIKGPYSFKVTISINGPRAETITRKVRRICKEHDIVGYCFTENPGKGHGVLAAWQDSSADILTYMDIDLATSLDSFEQLIDEIKGGADICIGSRYLPESKLRRTAGRYVLSRLYHTILIQAFLGLPISDVQCGFKAIDKKAFQKILPHLLTSKFFFEAELVYIGHRMNMNIIELPVSWVECTVSGVKLFSTSVSFFVNAIQLKMRLFGKKF